MRLTGSARLGLFCSRLIGTYQCRRFRPHMCESLRNRCRDNLGSISEYWLAKVLEATTATTPAASTLAVHDEAKGDSESTRHRLAAQKTSCPLLPHVLLRPSWPPPRLTARRILRPIPRRVLERVAEHSFCTAYLALARRLGSGWRCDQPVAPAALELALCRRRRRRLLLNRAFRSRGLLLRARLPLRCHLKLPCKCLTLVTPSSGCHIYQTPLIVNLPRFSPICATLRADQADQKAVRLMPSGANP